MAEKKTGLINRRHIKNYLINRHDQLRFVLITLIYMSVIVMLTVIIVLFPYFSDIIFSEEPNVQYRSSQIFLILVSHFLPAVVIIFFLVALHQIYITHRVWGALVNIANTIKMVSNGDFTRKVFLRKNDYLKVECRLINEMLESLSSYMSKINHSHSELESTLNDIWESVENLSTKKEFEACLGKIRNKTDLLKEDLSRFKLK